MDVCIHYHTIKPAWHGSDPPLEADFLKGIRIQLLGFKGRRTAATIHARPDTQDLSKATFPNNIPCFPHSELRLCQSGASSSKFPHCQVYFSKRILNCVFAFTTLSRTRGIQSHRSFMAVNNHLDGPKMSIRHVSRGLSFRIHLFDKIVHVKNLDFNMKPCFFFRCQLSRELHVTTIQQTIMT